MDWRKEKTIEEASRLDHGTVLYVEEGNPKGKLDEFQWHQEFTKDQDRLTLTMNDPNTDPEGQVFSVKIDVRKDNTLLELKQKVGELYNLNPSDFVLKRYLNHRELKNMSAKLAELGITNQNIIKVERGRPHQDGVYEVNIHQVSIIGHKSPTSDLSRVNTEAIEDSTIFEKQFLFKVQIAPDAPALEFKHKILEKYNEHLISLGKDPVSEDMIRIRNPKSDDLGDVINDSSSLDTQFLYDEKEIYLQVADPDMTYSFVSQLNPSNCYHIVIREFNGQTWELGPPYEVKVDRNERANRLSDFLSEKIFKHISPENLACTKVSAT